MIAQIPEIIYLFQAANQRKFDDWYAMYCILEDQYFKEVKTASNTPPTLPSGYKIVLKLWKLIKVT